MDQKTLKRRLSSGEMSDLTVIVGKREFRLHTFPMTLASEYFACLLRSGMSDSRKVTLKDFPGGEETMDLITKFCYSQPITDMLSVENIGHVMCASHYLQMPSLTTECQSKLQQLTRIKVSNCFKILSSCVDVVSKAEASGLATVCIEEVVRYWKTCTWKTSPKPTAYNRQLSRGYSSDDDLLTDYDSVPIYDCSMEELAEWVTEMTPLPVQWVVRIIEALATNMYKLGWQELLTNLIDQLLNYYVQQDCLSASDFASLLRASKSVSRTSHDSLFEILEKVLAGTNRSVVNWSGVRMDTYSITNSFMQQIDFSKLSQGALERAAGNQQILQCITQQVALGLYTQLRKQVLQSPEDWIQKINGQWKTVCNAGTFYGNRANIVLVIKASKGPNNMLKLQIDSKPSNPNPAKRTNYGYGFEPPPSVQHFDSRQRTSTVPQIYCLPITGPTGYASSSELISQNCGEIPFPFLLFDVTGDELLTPHRTGQNTFNCSNVCRWSRDSS